MGNEMHADRRSMARSLRRHDPDQVRWVLCLAHLSPARGAPTSVRATITAHSVRASAVSRPPPQRDRGRGWNDNAVPAVDRRTGVPSTIPQRRRMAMVSTRISPVREVAGELRAHRGWFIALGIALTILGIIALSLVHI